MPPKKWYVVVQGRDVGVYETWIEAGPLVSGLKHAVHQSFESEEQAYRLFDEALTKGHVRTITDDDSDGTISSRYNRSSPASSGTYAQNATDYGRNRASHSFSSPRKPINPDRWLDSYSGSSTKVVTKTGSLGTLPATPVPRAPPLTRAPSEPAAGSRSPYSSGHSINQERRVYGAAVGAPSRYHSTDGARTATPKTHSFPFSACDSDYLDDITVDDDPEWIRPYPMRRTKAKTPKPAGNAVLSPLETPLPELDSTFGNMSLQDGPPRLEASPKAATSKNTPSPASSSTSFADSLVYVGGASRGVAPTVERVPPKWSDPRSPNSAVKSPKALKHPWTSPNVRPSPGNRPPSLLLEPATTTA